MKNTKKATKISDLVQVDGRKHEDVGGNENKNITRIDQLLSSTAGLSKYGTFDIDEYTNELNQMNTAELRTHAINKAGIIPNEDRNRLIKQLQKRFKDHVSAYRKPVDNDSTNISKENADKVLKILKAVK